MEFGIIFISLLVFTGIGGYVFLMVFYPEWVGITGEEAKKTLAEHQGDTPKKEN